MATAFITHGDCLKHDMGAYHPECPERLAAIDDQLIASGIGAYLEHHDAPLATLEQLARVHPDAYIEAIRSARPARGIVHLDPDTAMNPSTWDAALRAAGAAVLGTDLVAGGKAENAFCSVRPPGHHATRDAGDGLLLLQQRRRRRAHALDVHGLERVAIVDFDVHHGNGTEDIIADDERVLMVSTFQHPFYPYSGTETRRRTWSTCRSPAGTGEPGLPRGGRTPLAAGARRISRRRWSSSRPGSTRTSRTTWRCSAWSTRTTRGSRAR